MKNIISGYNARGLTITVSQQLSFTYLQSQWQIAWAYYISL